MACLLCLLEWLWGKPDRLFFNQTQWNQWSWLIYNNAVFVYEQTGCTVLFYAWQDIWRFGSWQGVPGVPLPPSCVNGFARCITYEFSRVYFWYIQYICADFLNCNFYYTVTLLLHLPLDNYSTDKHCFWPLLYLFTINLNTTLAMFLIVECLNWGARLLWYR